MGFIVAVDGTTGSGKGSVTKVVAERLNLVTIDTGAMYRCVTLAMLEQNIGTEELDKIANILKDIKIEFVDEGTEKKVFLNGKICYSNSQLLKQGDIVSVRGFGKFIYGGMISTTKKGRCFIALDKYI